MLGGFYRVAKKHRPGHRAHTAQSWSHPSRDLADGLIDVGDDALSLAGDPAADDRGAWLHHVGGHQVGNTGSRDDDVRLAGVGAHVADARVHNGDRGVGGCALEGHQKGHRSPDGEAAPDDHHMAALDRHAVVLEHDLDAPGRARQRPVDAHDKATQIDGVEAVGVLGRIDSEEGTLLIELFRKRELHDERVHCWVVVEALNRRVEGVLLGVLGEMLVDGVDPHLATVADLGPDIALRRGIASDEDGSQARGDRHLGHLCPDLVLDRLGQCLAVENRRGHGHDTIHRPTAV